MYFIGMQYSVVWRTFVQFVICTRHVLNGSEFFKSALLKRESSPRLQYSVLYAVCQISHCTHQVQKLESPGKIQLSIKGTVSQK